ncbi:MAG TPA: SPOR domain-containing protein [Arenimonas sp.]|nr:SPOR domain-containing protein [Arenimonas sp.]HPW32821.1 SPOR domain-containing protein [Arenimonas sp.]
METPVKQRLIGALVLALVAILFLPMLLKPDVKAPDVSEVPLDMPKAPESEFETRDLPLNVPAGKTPEGGVLGVPKAPVDTTVETPTNDQAVANPQMIAPAVVPLANTAIPAESLPVEAPKPVEAKPIVTPPKPVVAVKPAESKPADVKPANIAAGNFTIAVGSYSNMESANALVARLKAQKLPVLTEKISIDGKPALKIRIGPYTDRANAETARLKVDEIAGGASKVNVQDASPSAASENKKPATSSKPATATAVSSGFSVQLEALSDNAKAEEMRNRARSMGFNAFVKRVETEKGVLYSVRLGPVADREAANKLRDEATQKLGKTGIVKTHP